MKICPVGAEFLYADRLTDMTKLIVAFFNCTKGLKNGYKDLSSRHGSLDDSECSALSVQF
jgi:hypothetical protein